MPSLKPLLSFRRVRLNACGVQNQTLIQRWIRLLAAAAILIMGGRPSAQAQPTTTLTAGFVPAVTINGLPGSLQLIQYSTNLADTNGWTSIGAVRLIFSSAVFADTTATNQAHRFYRAQTLGLADTDLVWIPPGTFVMGCPDTEQGRDPSEGPQTTVTFTQGFFMGRFLVTDGDWIAMMTNLPSPIQSGDTNLVNYGMLPVRGISWTDATNYCAVRTAVEAALGRIPPGWAFRLPTEAEWEYACRAGTTTPFSIGLGTNLFNDGHERDAWFQGSYPYPTNLVPSGPINPTMATQVGQFATNGFGLYDVHGNVLEYCLDTFNLPQGFPTNTYTGIAITNPPPAMATNNAVADGSATVMVRGGSWNLAAVQCRSASRLLRTMTYGRTHQSVGFRVVLSPVTY